MTWRASAEISSCGKYCYWLRRSLVTYQPAKTVCFVMLNPSTADAKLDDPTIRHCKAFALVWGYNVLTIRNLYAYRAIRPADLCKADDPVGPLGDVNLAAALTADMVVCAWGINAKSARVIQAMQILGEHPTWCLGRTKSGAPRHPLYVSAATKPVIFSPLEYA
jgi:hypothetical protein